MGIWHGLSLHYILYGVYHGILLALTNWYQKKSKFYKKNKKKKWFIALQTFVRWGYNCVQDTYWGGVGQKKSAENTFYYS